MKLFTKILSMLSVFNFSLNLSAEELAVGLVLDNGGKDDKSFNSSAYAGLIKAEKELKVKTKFVESPDNNAFEGLINRFASDGKYKLIICVGFAQTDALKKIAPKYPKINFAIVDSVVEQPNVRSLAFAEHEGSFLVGALAALTTKTQKIGFVGGMNIPIINRFFMGYEAGAKYINSKINISSKFVGTTPEAWADPTKAKELAKQMYNDGADIIFGAAGKSGLGIFDAAVENKKFAIGVDSNQNYMKPGFVLTSMLKRVDVAVYETIKDAKNNLFKDGLINFGLANKGVDYAIDEHNKALIPQTIIDKVEKIKADIVNGKIVVPDYYKLKK